MFYIFTTQEQGDIRLSPTRAASAIRRVFGHKVTIDKCVYVTKSTVIYTATGNIKSNTAFGGIIQVCSAPMLSDTLTQLVTTGNLALRNKLADFTAMLGRLEFYDSDYIRYKFLPRKPVVTTKPDPKRNNALSVGADNARVHGVIIDNSNETHRYTVALTQAYGARSRKVKDKLRLVLGRLMVGDAPLADLSNPSDNSYLMGCLLHYRGNQYSDDTLSDFLNEMFEKYGQLSAAKSRSTPC